MTHSTPNYFSPFAAILFQSRLAPSSLAVIHGQRLVTYGAFTQHIDRVTRRLASQELRPGMRVGVNIADEYLHWLVVLALARMAVVSVSLPRDGKSHDFTRTAAAVVDGGEAIPGRPNIAVDESWFGAQSDDLSSFQDRRFGPEVPCRMVLSSGTTGVPKKVMLTFEQIRTRFVPTARAYRLEAGSRLLNTMTIGSIGGFMTPVNCWTSGGTVVLEQRSRRESLASLFMRTRPNTLFTSTAQLGGLVQGLPREFFAADPVSVFVAGSALPLALNRATRMRLSQRLFMVYGSTEAGTIAVAHASAAEGRPDFVGHVMPTAEVQVIDASGQPLPAGQEGEIRIRADGMSTSYLDDPKSSAETFVDGWFRPGDLGTLDGRGGLSVAGRVAEVLNLGGVKLHPHAVETALAGVPGVSDLAVFEIEGDNGTSKAGIAVVPLGDDLADEALVARFRSKYPKVPAPQVLRVEAIPRNEMGKVLRAQLGKTARGASGLLH